MEADVPHGLMLQGWLSLACSVKHVWTSGMKPAVRQSQRQLQRELTFHQLLPLPIRPPFLRSCSSASTPRGSCSAWAQGVSKLLLSAFTAWWWWKTHPRLQLRAPSFDLPLLMSSAQPLNTKTQNVCRLMESISWHFPSKNLWVISNWHLKQRLDLDDPFGSLTAQDIQWFCYSMNLGMNQWAASSGHGCGNINIPFFFFFLCFPHIFQCTLALERKSSQLKSEWSKELNHSLCLKFLWSKDLNVGVGLISVRSENLEFVLSLRSLWSKILEFRLGLKFLWSKHLKFDLDLKLVWF